MRFSSAAEASRSSAREAQRHKHTQSCYSCICRRPRPSLLTGHKTTDVVLKHYFRPGQEDFRLALEGAMPKLLTMGSAEREPKKAQVEQGGSAKQEMRELLGQVKPKALRERLLKVWAKW